MYKRKLALATAAAFAVVATEAPAKEVNFTGMGLKKEIKYKHFGSKREHNAGEMLIEFKGADLTAYCVDLDHTIQEKWEAKPVPVSTINGGLAIAWLYDHFMGSVATDVEAAGLQAAIWEVLDDYGNGLDLGSGNFRLIRPNHVIQAAQDFLDALPSDLSNYTTQSYILESGDHPRSQNLIVPEPATLVLLGLAMPMFLAHRRRREFVPYL